MTSEAGPVDVQAALDERWPTRPADRERGRQDGPPVRSRRVHLVPTTHHHQDFLFDLSMSDANATFWRYGGATPSPQEFGRWLWENILVSHTIFSVRRGCPVGQVTAYRPDMASGTVYMALILEPSPDRAFLAHEASLLFVNYLFTCWPFRKIYGEVSERNVPQFESGLKRLTVEEVRLKDHEYFNGRYWDFLIVALLREPWLEHLAQHLPRILAPAGGEVG